LPTNNRIAITRSFDALYGRLCSLESKLDRIAATLDELRRSIDSLVSMTKATIWLIVGGFSSMIALETVAITLHWI
jgi:hypothetical protein